MRFLELLDRSERAGALAPDVVATLERSALRDVSEHPWLGAGGDSFRSHGNQDTSVHPDLGAVLAALELMQRFGVPSGVDLRALRAHLLGRAQRSGFGERDVFGARAALALAQLEARFPEAAGVHDRWQPSERWVACVLALLLGAVCVGWTALARPRGGVDLRARRCAARS